MRYLTFSLLCFSLLYARALPAGQAEATTSVFIKVTDPTGNVVPGARIRVVPAPDHPPAKMETDSKGQLSLNLKSGGYALFVSAPGFAHVAMHIDIPGSQGTQTIPVRLQIAAGDGKVVHPASDKDALFLSTYPYHEDVLIKPAEFKSLSHITLTVRNAHTNADETYSGVPLAELLAKYGAPLGKELRGIALASYVVGTGSDGYQAVLSLAEVDPAFHPGTVIIADTMNGSPSMPKPAHTNWWFRKINVRLAVCAT